MPALSPEGSGGGTRNRDEATGCGWGHTTSEKAAFYIGPNRDDGAAWGPDNSRPSSALWAGETLGVDSGALVGDAEGFNL